MTMLQQYHTQIKVLVQNSLWYQTSLQLMGVGFLSLQPWQQWTSERTCTTNHALCQHQYPPDLHQCRLFPVPNTKGNTETESSSVINVYLLITEWISQTYTVIFGLSCAGQGVGLDDPLSMFYESVILWLVSWDHPHAQQHHREPPGCWGNGVSLLIPRSALNPHSRLSLGLRWRPELRPFSGIRCCLWQHPQSITSGYYQGLLFVY